MKETLNTYEIADRLFRDENAGWSYNGAKALAEYLEQLEQDCVEELEEEGLCTSDAQGVADYEFRD